LRPCVIYGRRDRQFVPRLVRFLRFGFAPAIDDGVAILSVVHAANVADGMVRAALADAAGGQAYNLTNDYPVTVAEFFRLAGVGLGRRMRLLRIPLGAARPAIKAVGLITRVATAGRFNVVADGSLGFL